MTVSKPNPKQVDILELLLDNGAMERQSICNKLEISWSTCYDNLKYLESLEKVERYHEKSNGKRGASKVMWKLKKENEKKTIYLSPFQQQILKYLAIKGISQRSDIVKELGIARTTVYDNLKKLRKKGIVLKVKQLPNKLSAPFTLWYLKDESLDGHKCPKCKSKLEEVEIGKFSGLGYDVSSEYRRTVLMCSNNCKIYFEVGK